MNDTLQRVARQYEAHPYPLPEPDLDDYLPGPGCKVVAASPWRFFHLYWPCQRYRQAVDILVAGCGTSQAAKYALQQPQGRVVGIDVSRTSLDHTDDLVRRYRLDNLSLHELPIERVGELDRDFDLIVCTGVLHHLADPDLGLRALRGVLRPGGAMYLMVYATHGRSGVYMFADYCRLMGVGATDQELTDLRAVIERCDRQHPLAIIGKHGGDFAYAAGMRDLFLHPCDRPFTVPQVYDWLGRCGMSMSRWYYQSPYLPQCSVLDGSAHLQRLMSLPGEKQHAAMELFRGTMHKHVFVACRNDRDRQSYAIDLESQAWRRFVPVRWTGIKALHQDLPPGTVVRLQQMGHRFADIVAQLDAPRAKLFDMIDGQRTIEQIMAQSGLKGSRDDLDRYARGFFQALWNFDLVMFAVSS